MALTRQPTPAGPITELFDRLHDLHLRAGQPSLRRMKQGLGRDGPSHGTVHNVFTGTRVPAWEHVEQIVGYLGGDVEWFRALWIAARSAEQHPADPTRAGPLSAPESGVQDSDGHGRLSRQYPFVMVTYRLPTDERVSPIAWQQRVVGTGSALGDLLRGHTGAWIGAHGTATIPRDAAFRGMALHQIHLTADDVERHYEGFSNSSVWPLYHYCVERPEFRPAWDNANRAVNRRFADAVVRLAAPGATVWIHDYHLQLVPSMVRDRRQDLRIGFFLHIPFPAPEVFEQLPTRDEILHGLIGADVLGFQQPLSAENFLRLARKRLACSTAGNIVTAGKRRVVVDSFPISVDVDQIERLVESPRIRARLGKFRADLGKPRTILLGIDRLDYTKGIEQRLLAYGALLETGDVRADDTVLVQVGTPTRERIGAYAELRGRIDQLAGRLSAQHPRIGSSAVPYRVLEPTYDELLAMYAAADVMVVTPLRDGMNLVAKEFVASRIDNRGVLVLSEFAGAAAELEGALLVNPNDREGMKRAILEAITMEAAEQERRMDAMRRRLHHHDLGAWAAAFLQRLGRPISR